MLRRTSMFVALAALAPLAACDDVATVGSPGVMTLMLTDAPGDFTQARVVIDRIELAGGDEGDGEDTGRPVLLDEPFTTDLLTLSNDVVALVEDATVPAGTYGQIRFVISAGCIGVEQEDLSEMIYASPGFEDCGVPDGALQMPSFGQSGLKVTMPGGAIQVDGDSHVLLLDFDVSESFGHEAGGSGRWVMHPVIHATDIAFAGSITVELTAAESVDLAALGSSLADFQATLSGETEPVAFTDPEDDGVFTATFLFLMSGMDYEVGVGLQDGVTAYDFTLDPTSPQNVSLGVGAQATIAFEVTAAAPSS